MKWIDKLSLFIGESISYFYLVAVVITVYEVFMRYLFNAPTLWAHELTILLCAFGYLWSSGYVTQKNTHIRITALYDLLPARVQWLLDLFSIAFGFSVMVLLFYSAWGQGILAIRVWESTGSSWDPPTYALLKPAIIVGAALICLQNISNFFKLLQRWPGPDRSPVATGTPD
jgi:TRAP-type mannitol/chloroaromatic compound transport system permease small subunit